MTTATYFIQNVTIPDNQYFSLPVNDLNKAISFYDELLSALNLQSHNQKGCMHYWLKENSFYLEVYRPSLDQGPEYDGNIVSLEVANKYIVDLLFDKIINLGILEYRKPSDYCSYQKMRYAFYFNDHEGFPVEIFTQNKNIVIGYKK
jgi:predicted lactoylglutathione lyase